MYHLIGDVGAPELLIFFVVVMLVFDGSKLPEVGSVALVGWTHRSGGSGTG